MSRSAWPGSGTAPGSPPISERTPTAAAHLDVTGAATYEFDLDWQLDPELEVAAGHVHTGSIAATLQPGGESVAAIVARARQTATVSYDPNARPSLMVSADLVRDEIESLVAASDVVKASDEDIAWLYPGRSLEEVLTGWANLGPQVCAVTRGGEGALVLVQEEFRQFAAPPTVVVDTVGAGDSFMSGFVSGLLDAGLLGGVDARDRLATAGWDEIAPAVERALACAAITVSRAGANPPTRAEL
jgi:fructokinase